VMLSHSALNCVDGITGKSIELRHQRSPDVTLDFVVSPLDGRRVGTPRDAYVAMETMLPTAYDGKGRGQVTNHTPITLQSQSNHRPITLQSQSNHRPITLQSHSNLIPIKDQSQ
jgi:hypothetical protein